MTDIAAVRCIHCGKEGTHRVCDECFKAPATAALCPAHGKPWVPGEHAGRRRCEFYIPEFGVSEDYGCPQDSGEELLWRIFGATPEADCG